MHLIIISVSNSNSASMWQHCSQKIKIFTRSPNSMAKGCTYVSALHITPWDVVPSRSIWSVSTCFYVFRSNGEHLCSSMVLPVFAFHECGLAFANVCLIDHFGSRRSKSNACRRPWLSHYRGVAIKLLDMESCTWSCGVVRMYLQSRPIGTVYQPPRCVPVLCTNHGRHHEQGEWVFRLTW